MATTVEPTAAGMDAPATPATHGLRRLFTRQEFERAGELGIFGPEERLELIDGEVIVKVSPQLAAHATAVRMADEALRRAFAAGHDVRVQLPLALGPHHEPEPDVAVVRGAIRDYEREHPSTAVLVAEVADTTLRLDRTVKAGVYAAAGISEYWILNLRDRVLEVHRDPAPMADQPMGHHYRSVTRHAEAETVSPLAAPTATIRVSDLLPSPAAG